MLGKLNPRNVPTNLWIIIGTLTFFVLFYLIYLEFYINSQESRIVSTGFRVLDQLGDNIQNKIKSYQSNANQFDSKILVEAEKKIKRSSTYSEKSNASSEKTTILSTIYDVYNDIVRGNTDQLSSYLNKDLEVVGIKKDMGNGKSEIFPKKFGPHTFKKTLTESYFYFNPVNFDLTYYMGYTIKDTIYVRTKYSDLLKGLLRPDVFDELFIINSNQIVFSTFQSDLLLGNIQEKLGYSGNEDEEENKKTIDDQENELLIPTKKEAVIGHIYSGEFLDFSISNKKYKLFFKPVKINGEVWFLCGLLDKSKFDSTKLSISPWIIIILSVILILILLGLPLIKLKVISKSEQLGTSSITNSALSILLGSSVITLFILSIAQYTGNERNTNTRLESFSDTVYNSLITEINDAFHQLIDYDVVHDHFNFDDKSRYSKGPVIPDILNMPHDSISYPRDYIYADYLFWLNDNGKQSAYLTPFNSVGSLSDLKNRDYFKKKDEWFLPSDSTKKFRLESIVSITSGNHKVAISTSSRVKDNPVVALSSRFYSLIDPLVPRNFGFCIVDESGKVWFHSNKNRNLMENFISECNDDSEIKSAIYSRSNTHISVKYYNEPHRIYIRPIEKLPLYLVTFYNSNADTSFLSQVFTLTLILIGLFFTFIFIQVIILIAMERQLQWKLSKNLIMKITRPMLHLKNHYKFLFWIYIISGVITVSLLSVLGNLQSILLIYSFEIIIFAFSFRTLNHNSVKVKRRKLFTRINLTILVIMDFIYLFNVNFFANPQLTGLIIPAYQIILIIFLEFTYRKYRSKLEKTTVNLDTHFIKSYVLYLISMAFIFSVLPALKFFEIGYNIESEIRLKHNQFDLMKQKQNRNLAWNEYYTSQIVQTENTRRVLKKRKEAGIFTEFLNGLRFVDAPDTSVNTSIHVHSGFDLWVAKMRPMYDEDVVENKFLLNSKEGNADLIWLNINHGQLALKYLSQTEDPGSKKLAYKWIVSNEDKINFMTPFHGKAFAGFEGILYNITFWFCILFILYIFYYLIRFGIRNIYSLDIVQNYSHESFVEIIRHQMLANKDIFIVKLSIKDETTELEQGIQKDIYLDWSDVRTVHDSAQTINNSLEVKKQESENALGTADQIKNKSNKSISQENCITVFIDHFEWRFDDPALFKEKLNVLWEFIDRKDIRLIVLSQVHPDKIIAYYRDISDQSMEGASDMIKGSMINLSELNQIKNNIIINYLPTRFNYSWKDEDKYCIRSKTKMSIRELINVELDASDYLKQFKNALHNYYETYCAGRNIDYPEELVITKINATVDSYYKDIFDTCSDEEKYVLFDLAEDLIMNQKNTNAIYSLLQKGLLIKKCDKINFMNVSFRRYVMFRLSQINLSEFKQKIDKEAGNWQGYKFTLIIIIVGLFIFIALANQNFIDNLNQLFIAIGGGITVITGIFSVLSRKNTEGAKS